MCDLHSNCTESCIAKPIYPPTIRCAHGGAWGSALEDRQVVGGDGEDDDGDRGLIDGADLAAVRRAPGAVGVLAVRRHEVLHQAAVPVFPVLAAHLVHGVGGVVVAVEEVDGTV